LVDADRRRRVVVGVIGAIDLGRGRADQVPGRTVVARVGARGRIGAVELEADRPGRVAGAAREGGRVGQVDRAALTNPEGAAGVGGQRRAERFDDRVLARVAALGRRVAVVGVTALVAGDPVVGAGRVDRD